MVSLAVAACEVAPLLAVTVIAYVPALPPLTESVEVPDVSDDLENDPLTPPGELENESVTVPVNPPLGVTVTV